MFDIEIPTGDADESALECPICCHEFCSEETCCRTETHQNCCDQPICCSCLQRQLRRCTCSDECNQIITICAYCREITPVTALEVFLGHKPPCAGCLEGDTEEVTMQDEEMEEEDSQHERREP